TQVSKGAGWHWDNRGWLEVDGDGAVLDGLEVDANVNVTASNVTLKNMRILVGGETFGVSLRHTSNVVIQDTDITSPDAGSGRLMVGVKDVYGDASDTTIRRTDISHT